MKDLDVLRRADMMLHWDGKYKNDTKMERKIP